jgi:hypothetical protein
LARGFFLVVGLLRTQPCSGFSYLNWYNKTPQVGLEVYTAGFPFGQPQYTLTKGIISEANADGDTTWASLDHVLMHDATINPGNSGGPLVSDDGQVVGINYASNNANQYFAIDAATAKPLVDQLKTGNDLDSIGINGMAFVIPNPSISGIWISSVKSGSPADKVGMKAGDILLQMEGLVLATDGTMKDYCSILRTHKSTDALSVRVYRSSTGEILEGELNGSALQVTKTIGTPNLAATSAPILGNATATSAPTANAPAYYTENFTGDLSNWSPVVVGDKSQYTYSLGDGKFSVELNDLNLAVLYFYNPYVYTDVALDLVYTNRGTNSNNINLVCRASSDGWYEFTVQNDGLYSIWAADKVTNGYHELYDGGSNAINMGRATNEISASCIGNTLTLYINSVEVHSLSDTTYNFSNGQVGFGVNVNPNNPSIPVIVDYTAFTINKP